MTTDVMATLRDKARISPQRIVFPESSEENIILAARQVFDEGVALPILLGDPAALAELAAKVGVSLEDMEVINVTDEAVVAGLVQECAAVLAEISPKSAERKFRSNLNIGSFLVRAGRADAMVAGLAHATQDVILAAMTFIGMREGITTPSSIFLMRVPGFEGPEGEQIVFADCAVAVAPDASELADIALTTAHTVRALLGWEPRIAMLSFSTKGSGEGESVEKVLEALRIAKERDPYLAIDGELQLDSAIVPAVAARKVPGESLVAGRANVLIFPDLDAGNIAYKAVQRFARADAFGAFLQGFAKTVSDLSRGASVADIAGLATMASVHAQGLKRLETGHKSESAGAQ
jgi:phosphate acetyltransferase